jgi:hypothetical protein
MSSLQPSEEKLLSLFSFLSSPNKQKTEHQSESNPANQTPSPWKASLHCTTLKTEPTFLPNSWLQSQLCETAEGTGMHYTPHTAPLSNTYPYPLLGKQSSTDHEQTESPPSKTKNHTQ